MHFLVRPMTGSQDFQKKVPKTRKTAQKLQLIESLLIFLYPVNQVGHSEPKRGGHLETQKPGTSCSTGTVECPRTLVLTRKMT